MAKYSIEGTTLTGIADAIREKTETTEDIPVTEMRPKILGITSGGAELTIVATTKAGATVTATKGALSVSAVATDGTATLKVPEGGTWVVVATLNGYSSEEMAVEVITTFSTELEIDEIYGAEWDGTSNPAWSRTDMAAGFVDPVPYVAGATEYGSPFDNIMPWAGMEVVEDAEAGTLVKIPKFWFKWTRNGTAMKLQISPRAVEGFFVSPAHADRGDGKGERDFVYVGRYHCGSAYKSVSGQTPKTQMTRATARSSISALGNTVWQYDFAMRWTIAMLYLVEFAHWDTQGKIGYGCGDGSSVQTVGASDSMPYHTGTMQVNRTTYGIGVQYRHIEGLWDGIFEWCDGIYFSDTDVYCIKNPAEFSDSSGGVNTGTRAAATGVASAWNTPEQSGFEYALYPSETSGSEETYVCDSCLYASTGTVLYCGGNYSSALTRGMFCFYGNESDTKTGKTNGCRLMKLP